jgi:putative PIN family toxin of toxin-antitoxin system
MSETPPAAVFDCTVFLQALANRKGPAFACWQPVDSGRVTLYLSDPELAEVTEVLNRPELHQKLKTLTPEKVQAYLATVRTRATFIADVPHHFTYPRDPKDEPYLNLAIASGSATSSPEIRTCWTSWTRPLRRGMTSADSSPT